MPLALTITVDAADVDQFLTEMHGRASDPSDVLDFIRRDMVVKFRANIDAESGGPDFPGWSPLSEGRVAERERHGLGGEHPMLKGETGDLYGHIISSALSSMSVSAGTDGSLIYPETHDLGEDSMPQRSFVWIDDTRLDGWLEVLALFIVEGTPPPAVEM